MTPIARVQATPIARGANNSLVTQIFYSTTGIWHPNDMATYGVLIKWNIDTIRKSLKKSATPPGSAAQRHAFMRTVSEAANIPMAARSGLGQLRRRG